MMFVMLTLVTFLCFLLVVMGLALIVEGYVCQEWLPAVAGLVLSSGGPVLLACIFEKVTHAL